MIREDYIIYRNNNTPEPLYEYYKEKYKGDKLLDMGDFFQAMQLWPHATEALLYVLREYDVRFNVISVQNLKTGQILKYY